VKKRSEKDEKIVTRKKGHSSLMNAARSWIKSKDRSLGSFYRGDLRPAGNMRRVLALWLHPNAAQESAPHAR
jgi:hypothetical protein